MIVIYQRSPDSLEYHAIAKWEDGEWIDGADRMSHVPDEEVADADLLLDRFSGPGKRTAVQVADPDDAPDSFEPRTTDAPDANDEDVPTIELSDTRNWMRRDVDNTTPPDDPTKPLTEMTEEEIRDSFSDPERAERVIQSLRESDEDTVV